MTDNGHKIANYAAIGSTIAGTLALFCAIVHVLSPHRGIAVMAAFSLFIGLPLTLPAVLLGLFGQRANSERRKMAFWGIASAGISLFLFLFSNL